MLGTNRVGVGAVPFSPPLLTAESVGTAVALERIALSTADRLGNTPGSLVEFALAAAILDTADAIALDTDAATGTLVTSSPPTLPLLIVAFLCDAVICESEAETVGVPDAAVAVRVNKSLRMLAMELSRAAAVSTGAEERAGVEVGRGKTRDEALSGRDGRAVADTAGKSRVEDGTTPPRETCDDSAEIEVSVGISLREMA